MNLMHKGYTTGEICQKLDLTGTELIVLSACETGLGKVEQGEGVYGLRCAFQVAGARTVISALWPLSDRATANIMGKMYQCKRTTLPWRLQALQLEEIHRLRDQGHPDHPVTWGGFVVVGDWK
jgi:CHAT domain-containing protein